jgi:hypothetical protein
MLKTLLLLLMALAAPCVHAQSKQPPSGPAGRYQLFQGNYEFVNLKGEAHWTRALFKLDTVTGEIFICEGRQIEGRDLTPPQPGKMVQRHYCAAFEKELVVPSE